jgi:hypothetical protein
MVTNKLSLDGYREFVKGEADANSDSCFRPVFQYVGYNEDMNYSGFSPFAQIQERGLRRSHRTFFIKISYLFRHEL